jgi:hypothetical protein
LFADNTLNDRNQGSLDKWLILGLGQEIYDMNMEHVVLPESKETLKKEAKKRKRKY